MPILPLPAPAQMRGKDIRPLLKGGSLSGGAILLEHAGYQLDGVVTPRYKYIRHRKTRDIHPAYPMRKGREELYDLSADPAETHDLAKERPEVLAELRKLRKTLWGRKSTYQAKKAPIDANTKEMLRSLGYTQ